MTLDEAVPGSTYAVTGYAFSDFQTRTKLLALGLTRGTRVKIVRTAPLGDPVELEVRGYMLSMRKDELKYVKVKQCETEKK